MWQPSTGSNTSICTAIYKYLYSDIQVSVQQYTSICIAISSSVVLLNIIFTIFLHLCADFDINNLVIPGIGSKDVTPAPVESLPCNRKCGCWSPLYAIERGKCTLCIKYVYVHLYILTSQCVLFTCRCILIRLLINVLLLLFDNLCRDVLSGQLQIFCILYTCRLEIL